jgi:hypothetical protein
VEVVQRRHFAGDCRQTATGAILAEASTATRRSGVAL